MGFSQPSMSEGDEPSQMLFGPFSRLELVQLPFDSRGSDRVDAEIAHDLPLATAEPQLEHLLSRAAVFAGDKPLTRQGCKVFRPQRQAPQPAGLADRRGGT